jgi:predicted Co/Zn/Cd cation transporter (cation efflux family)
VVVNIFCFFVFRRQLRLNRNIESELVGLEFRSRLMLACIASAQSRKYC